MIYRVLQSVQEQTAAIAATVKGHDRRFDSIERSLNSLRMDIAALSDLGVDQRGDIRSLAERAARIERRLDIADQTPAH